MTLRALPPKRSTNNRLPTPLVPWVLRSSMPCCDDDCAALLTREACRYISRVCALLFQPALVISSTGATLKFADLQDSWHLVAGGTLTIGVSAAVAWVSARLLLGPESRRAFRPMQLAIAFQNSASIPLWLMESLCEQDAIKR